MSLSNLAAGADETKLTREALKWPYGEFEIPDEVYDTFSAAGKKGQKAEQEWNKVCVFAMTEHLTHQLSQSPLSHHHLSHHQRHQFDHLNHHQHPRSSSLPQSSAP